MRLLILILTFIAGATGAVAKDGFEFSSIDGGTLDLEDWSGRPVLVANTASQCAFTPQYDELQALYDLYRDRGLVVLAVPSDDFNQELASEAEVKEFCDLNFDLDLPMTEITHVRGSQAHPFYQWVKAQNGFEPSWNFNKVLIGPDGKLVETYGSMAKPMSNAVRGRIETLLTK